MNGTDKNNISLRYMLGLLLGLTLLLVALSAYGFLLPFHSEHQQGAVMARGLVTPETENAATSTQAVIMAYDAAGEEKGEPVPLPDGHTLADIRIISRHEFQEQVELLEAWMAEHAGGLAEGARLMPREAFLGQSYTLADGQTPIAPPSLHPSIQSVLVRPQVHRHRTDPNELTLLRFTVDLSDVRRPGSNTRTLLLDRHGRIVHESPHILAPRTAFYGDPNQGQSSSRRTPEDTIFGPVTNARVEVFHFIGGVGATDSEGKYYFDYWFVCPPGGYTFPADSHVSLRYRSFNPQGAPTLPYLLARPNWVTCWAPPPPTGGTSLSAMMAYVAVLGMQPSFPPRQPFDFHVDVMFLTGTLSLAGPEPQSEPVPLGETHYRVFDPDETPTAATWYDFDGDGQLDEARLGRVETVTLADGSPFELFRADSDGDRQGIFLSSNPEENPAPEGFEDAGPQPDLIRLANTPVRREDAGLLGAISQEDLQDTDLLVFRESTGELIVERRGLKDSEIFEAEEAGKVGYRLMMRGPNDMGLRHRVYENRRSAWGDWAEEYGLEQPFRENPDNVLRVGERVSLVAINRATGYMDVQSVQLTSAGDTGLLNVPVEPLVLRPPNLKIWAERRYAVEYGLTAGEQRRYLLGAEGAGLTSDTVIEVTTEWLAPDGRPLPEGLSMGGGEGGNSSQFPPGSNYGLTGRLAKVTGPNELRETAEGNNLAHFPIAPGRQTQVIQLKDNLTVPEHYYIHVSGTQLVESPSFGNPQGGRLSGRPGRLTPFLVPLYDEATDWEGIRRFRDMRTQLAEEGGNTSTLPEPEPYYAWHYRPEYQFSRYSLEIDEIYRTSVNDEGETSRMPIYDLSARYLNTTDQMIELFYSLASAQFGRLPHIDGPQELVFSLGNYEIRAILGENGQITFPNLDHIHLLDPEDLIALRLYSNQDAGNILWEFAFGNAIIEGVELVQVIQDYWSFKELGIASYNPADGQPPGDAQKVSLFVPMLTDKPTVMRVYFKESKKESRYYEVVVSLNGDFYDSRVIHLKEKCGQDDQRVSLHHGSSPYCLSVDIGIDYESYLSAGEDLHIHIEAREWSDPSFPEAWNLYISGKDILKSKPITFYALQFCMASDEFGMDYSETSQIECVPNSWELLSSYIQRIRRWMPTDHRIVSVESPVENWVIVGAPSADKLDSEGRWRNRSDMIEWRSELVEAIDFMFLEVNEMNRSAQVLDVTLHDSGIMKFEVQNGDHVGGFARTGDGVINVWGDIADADVEEILFHEISHAWGRRHNNTHRPVSACLEANSPVTDWPYRDNYLRRFHDKKWNPVRPGVPFNAEAVMPEPNRVYDIMSYCEKGKRAPSSWTYRKIIEKIYGIEPYAE